jgi:RHS repeat-associated protein
MNPDAPAAGGRLKEEWRYEAGRDPEGTEASENTVYHYDPLGRRDSVGEYTKSPAAPITAWAVQRTTTYSYHSVTGAVTQKLTYAPGKTLGAGVLADTSIEYGYDETTGRHTATFTPHTRTEYGYDKLGRLQTVTAVKRNGNLVPNGGEVTRYTYDELGNLKTVTLPNHVVTTYAYDDLSRLDVETVDYVNGGTTRHIAKYDYALLIDGQRDYVDETTWDESGANPATVHINWTYDDWNRLINEKRGLGGEAGYYDTTYIYDPVGNRLHKSTDTDGVAGPESTVDYEYGTWNANHTVFIVNGNDWLLREEGHGTDVYTTTYGYDANGSLATQTRTGSDAETRVMSYDLRNKLVGVSTSGGSGYELAYQYDSDGDRVAKFTGTDGSYTSRTYYLVDANNPTGYSQVSEESSTLGGAPSITYDVGSDLLAQTPSSGPTVYFVYDGHGSLRGLANTGGVVPSASHLDYDAFGVALFNAATVGTKIGYTGERWDNDLHVLELRARDYTPATGRFDSFDRFEADPSSPADLHKYVFGRGDALNRIDPLGTFSYVEMLVTIGIGIAAGAIDQWLANGSGCDIAAGAGIGAAFGAGGYALGHAPRAYLAVRLIQAAAVGVGLGLGTVGTVSAWQDKNLPLAAFRGTLTIVGGYAYFRTPLKTFFRRVSDPPNPLASEPALLEGPSQGALNQASGAAFEEAVFRSLRATPSRTRVTSQVRGNSINTEPDLLGNRFGVTDIKDWVNLPFTEQLQGMHAHARGGPFNIIISPRTQTVSVPLQRAVQMTGGRIFQFDPATETWSTPTFNGPNVVR